MNTMLCHEVRELCAAYLDSELEAQSTHQIRAHLDHCSGCAAFYRAEQELDTALRQALLQRLKEGSWWVNEEAFARTAFRQREHATGTDANTPGDISVIASFWRELLWPSPKYYLALAAVWMVLLMSNWATAEPAKAAAAPGQQMSPQSKMALLEQRRELRELLAAPEPEAEQPETRRSKV